MRSDAGWRKEDGLGKDMWNHMAASPTPRSQRHIDSASLCPYGLPIAQTKESSAWDAQTVIVYRCHLGRKTGQTCRSTQELCFEAELVLSFPDCKSARAAATGGLSTD